MAVLTVVLATAVIGAFGARGEARKIVSANGVQVTVPAGWQAVTPATTAGVSDPKTLLVAGTRDVRSRRSSCQIAAYAIPPGGAVVVIIGWKSLTAAGGTHPPAGRRPLLALTTVRKGETECFTGLSASAQLWLAHRAFQVNVLVANGATKRRIQEALAVARSFDLAP